LYDCVVKVCLLVDLFSDGLQGDTKALVSLLTGENISYLVVFSLMINKLVPLGGGVEDEVMYIRLNLFNYSSIDVGYV